MTTCNRCGGTCAIHYDTDHYDLYGLIGAEVVGGYMSRALRDMTQYRFSLCEPCLAQMFGVFAMPPAVAHVDMGGAVQERTTWAADRASTQVWQQEREHVDAWRCSLCGGRHRGSWSYNHGSYTLECELGHEQTVRLAEIPGPRLPRRLVTRARKAVIRGLYDVAACIASAADYIERHGA